MTPAAVAHDAPGIRESKLQSGNVGENLMAETKLSAEVDEILGHWSDRLWVGPERQAWCDIGIAPDASVTYPGSRHRFCWIGDAPCRDGNPDDEVLHETVLGVDGRWRWTLDLGIEPR